MKKSNFVRVENDNKVISIPIYVIIIPLLVFTLILPKVYAKNDKEENPINIVEFDSPKLPIIEVPVNDIEENIESVEDDIEEIIDYSVDEYEIIEPVQILEMEEEEELEIPVSTIELETYTTSSGETYSIIGTLSIPRLEIENSILSSTSPELLNISLNRYWGPNPNEVGNMVVVGHNYRDNSTRFFSRLHNIEIGDIVKVQDAMGNTLNYVVYDTYVIDPYDNTCASQSTGGLTEITLITCYNKGTQRFVAKARAYQWE